MNRLDVYYRALREYMAQTAENRECAALRRAIAEAPSSEERITVSRTVCTVDEDWICAIEEGLVHIEKAIAEERQFIHSNGEVVPIEKVKQVSKESVRHLARHSDLITREPRGDDIIPDKLYTVERLNDYAVYENRFLYMLLCYLRDFVSVRYDRILELSNKYDGVLCVAKEVVLPRRRLDYRIELHDVIMDDDCMREQNSARDVIDRIDLILKTVVSLLATPLMETAAKAALLKPPITKTNVLKMDNSFKGAVALYDFIISYDRDGYSTEQKITELSPFSSAVSEELSELGALAAFLTYEHGLDLKGSLRTSLEREDARRREERLRAREEQLEAVKRRLQRGEASPEEYVLELERQLKLLQSENSKIGSMQREITELHGRSLALEGRISEQRERIESLREELLSADERRETAVREATAVLDARMNESFLAHRAELAELRAECDHALADRDSEIASWQARLSESRAELGALTDEHARLLDEKLACEARIKALRAAGGLMTEEDDFSERESFEELERELEAYLRFYESQWGKAKKKIRKKLLSYEYLKEQNGRKKKL